MGIETSTTVDSPKNPAERSYHRLFSLAGFFFVIFKNMGIFLFGIFIGLGIVLRDPPKDRNSIELINKLQEENKILKSKLKDRNDDKKFEPSFGQIQNGFLLR